MADGSNAPDFDPLNASKSEESEMVTGYLDEVNQIEPPRITGPAYDHGRRMARKDRAGVVDEDQHELARRYRRQQEARRG